MSEMDITHNATGERDDDEEPSLLSRIAANPRPAAVWVVIGLALLIVEIGALIGGLLTLIDTIIISATAPFDIIFGYVAPGLEQTVIAFQQAASDTIHGLRTSANGIPTLLNREVIPNQGYRTGPNGPWEGTFLGLQPALAWCIRVVLILAYSLAISYWVYRGWLIYQNNYRTSEWTPRDDVINRLRDHRWGQFGILILWLFLIIALFGPALGPSTVNQNIIETYDHEINYYSEETGSVETILVGDANYQSQSRGAGDQNVGPMSYDNFGRFHPFGTLPTGRDLFTFMMGGARITLIVAGVAVGISAFLAAVLSLLSSYYTGKIDLTTLTIADGIVSIPQLVLLIMVSMAFQDHWLAQILDGGFLIALVFGLTGWPYLWRAVRGPALQVAEEEWIDAAKSFGQRPTIIMRKHMFPYILGYLLVYASMSIGSVVIGLASLSFLGNGLGIQAPTPAWGRAVSMGQDFVATQSWHISLIPGLMIVILVTACNAFGDGIRDAIDPEIRANADEEVNTGGGAG